MSRPRVRRERSRLLDVIASHFLHPGMLTQVVASNRPRHHRQVRVQLIRWLQWSRRPSGRNAGVTLALRKIVVWKAMTWPTKGSMPNPTKNDGAHLLDHFATRGQLAASVPRKEQGGNAQTALPVWLMQHLRSRAGWDGAVQLSQLVSRQGRDEYQGARHRLFLLPPPSRDVAGRRTGKSGSPQMLKR